VVLGVVAFAASVVYFASSEDDGGSQTATEDSSTTLTSIADPAGPSTTVNPNPPASLPVPEPGAC